METNGSDLLHRVGPLNLRRCAKRHRWEMSARKVVIFLDDPSVGKKFAKNSFDELDARGLHRCTQGT